MTTMPRSSSSWIRYGRTSTIRAFAWLSDVMMPLWLPVKLIAGTFRAFSAIERRAIEIRSPAVRSMSSSRRAGFSVTCRASPSSSSVVCPIAETTTTRSSPWARRAAIFRATSPIFCTSATDVPPYF